MQTTALRGAAIGMLGLALLSGMGCNQGSGVEVRRDSQGNRDIKVDDQKLKDNLRQAGGELRQDARNLGQSIKQGAQDLDRQVGPAARESLGDAALTTHVKARLIAAPDLGGIHIHVSSRDGQVTLTGTVASPEFRQEAEKIARRTDGVQEVINQLEVGPVT